MIPLARLDPQIVGNVGLYYVCYQLSLLGWNAMPTTRNARGIDVVAYRRDGKGFLGLQVKTLSRRSPVPLGGSIERVMGDYWLIVQSAVSKPVVFVLKPKEVKRDAHRGEKDGKVSYWLQPKSYEIGRFREKWKRIGRGDGQPWSGDLGL